MSNKRALRASPGTEVRPMAGALHGPDGLDRPHRNLRQQDRRRGLADPQGSRDP